jgi:hypothetical protein
MQYGKGKAWTNIKPGMFSVWNWKNGSYDYYEAPPSAADGYGDLVKPPPAQSLSGLVGEDPDYSGKILPAHSKLVGSGDLALGEIASMSGNGQLQLSVSTALLIVLGPVAFVWLLAKASELLENRRMLGGAL